MERVNSSDALLTDSSPGSSKEDKWSCVSVISAILKGLWKAIDGTIDFAPLIVVQVTNGSFPPVDALGYGTIAAIFVLLISYIRYQLSQKQINFQLKTLDLGQFILFGLLWILAYIFRSNDYVDNLLVLWFNPFTTGGIALIMWVSVIRGKPFVFEIVESQMPPTVWKQLSSKKWFVDILTAAAMFWVQTMVAMALIVAIQPFLVTFFYNGEVNRTMHNLGTILAGGQYLILFYGIYTSAKNGGQREENKKKAKLLKDHGLDSKMANVYYPPISVTTHNSNATFFNGIAPTHHIRSLTSQNDLDHAGQILASAFRKNEMMNTFIPTDEGKISFFQANARAVSYFNLVLGCSSGTNNSSSPSRSIMLCVPVLSRARDEIKVYLSYEAWLVNGFEVTGSSSTNILLPDDNLIELGAMKDKPQNKLTKRPYIYIAYFGTDSKYTGFGYGRTLLCYIVELSETKQIPLVLETTTPLISLYERYGFKVVDRLVGKPEWVLMVREVQAINKLGLEEAFV